MKLSRLCSKVEITRDVEPAQSADSVYRCTFRESADAASSPERSALFELSPEGNLNRIVIPREGGMQLEFSFAAWQWNPTLDSALFQFVPPRNAVIVDGLLPDTPGLRH